MIRGPRITKIAIMNMNQLLRLLRPLLYRRGKGQKWVLLAVGLLIGYSFAQPYLNRQFGLGLPGLDRQQSARQADATSEGEQAILSAYSNKQSDVIVKCDLEVMKILPDDNKGSRHQKALLRLSNGHTVLLAHNIDLAERVPYQEGDVITVRGEYEFSDKGGVIHWTHHDPRGKHSPGWIEYQGTRYE